MWISTYVISRRVIMYVSSTPLIPAWLFAMKRNGDAMWSTPTRLRSARLRVSGTAAQ